MRAGPHIVHTVESSICYGEYMLSPLSLVDHVTSYALTRMAGDETTNDQVYSAPMILGLISWWWNGDIDAPDNQFDPSGAFFFLLD